MASTRYKTLLKDIFVFGLGNLGSKLILFLMVPLYTNYMSKAEYGTADLVFTTSQLLAPFLSVVIFDAVIRFGLSRNEKREDVLLVGFLVIIASAIVGLLVVPIAELYQTISEWRWYLYIYVVLHIANSVEYSYLKAKGKNKALAAIGVFQTALAAALNVFFLVFGSMGIRGYLLASIISNLVVDVIIIIVAEVITDLKNAHFDHDLLKRMVIYSSPLILNNISWWVIHSSDKYMVEIMISVTSLGLYTAAAKIPALINVMVSIFQKAWGISAIHEMESTNDGKYYSNVLNYLFLFITGACIFFVAIMKIFMQHYVGKEFIEAWHFVPLLLVSAVFAGIAGYFGSMYSALKKSVNNMLSTLLAAVVNIIVNWIFIPYTGIWGAVIGTVVSYIAVAFVRLMDVKRFVNITVDWKTLIPTCLIIIVQAVFVSLDYHIYLVSAFAVISFIAINFRNLQGLFNRIQGIRQKRIH